DQVNAALKTLTDTNTTPGSDNINVTATGSSGSAATPATIAVTVNGLPQIILNTPPIVGVNQSTAIPAAVSIAESGNTSGETFTVKLTTDATGTLSATGGVWDPATHTLTISGDLTTVKAALGTLTTTETTIESAAINVSVTDSLGNTGSGTLTLPVLGPGTNIFWTNLQSGQWFDGTSWTDNNTLHEVPLTSQSIFIDPSHNSSSAPVTVTLATRAGGGTNLRVASLGTLDITSGGSLTIWDAVDVSGLIDVGSASTFLVGGPVTIESSGEIETTGGTITFSGGSVVNNGTLLVTGGGALEISAEPVTDNGAIVIS